MKPADIPAVCEIHRRVLSTTLARIGLPYLSRLYRELLRSPSLHLVFVATSHSTIIGAIAATRSLQKTQQNLSHALLHPYSIWNICTALLFGRITLFELIDRLYTEHQIQRQFPSPYATILTFFVDKPNQKQGVGTMLLETLLQQIKHQNMLFTDTKSSNIQAQEWYKSHGFRPLKTIRNTVIFCQK